MYEAKNYDNLLGLDGFSNQSLQTHFKLYQGYVANTNKLANQLKEMSKQDKTGTPEYAELKRRFGWEFNGMRLHEYHFESLTKEENSLSAESTLYKKIEEGFGSYENWEKDFKATAALRGIGWAILYYDQRQDHLFNVWVNEHDLGHLAGAKIILNLDVFEHAYILDYNTDRASYINAFLKATDWSMIAKRLS